MESPNGNFIIKLTHLLENKRDGLIIIDGKWGTGKTFFIKNEFSRYYTHNAFYYISLLGVKTILDFKAKIIDCYYLKGIKSLQSGLETITAVGGISSGSPESTSVINGLLNSIGASVRENILSKLSGVFILDDIERITDNSLANEILTYCHSLYCESVTNNLDFIIISNTSSESELELHHKEKIISDSLHFNSTPEEILSMRLFEEKLSLLPAEDANIFREMAISYGIVNIRLLMRTLIISTPLYIYAAQHPEMAWNVSSKFILSSAFAYFTLLYSYNKTMDELNEGQKFYLPFPDEDADPLEMRLLSILNNYQITFDLKSYFSGYASFNDILEVVFSRNDPFDMINVVSSASPELNEVDEDVFFKTIVDVITKRLPCDLNTWLRTIKNYVYLTSNKYLKKSTEVDLKSILLNLDKFSDDEIIEYFKNNKEQERSRDFASHYDDINSLNEKLFDRYDNIIKGHQFINIKTELETSGWKSFNVEKLNSLDDFGTYKALELLSAPFITKCLLQKWDTKDIQLFNDFLASNYRVSNISSFALNEKLPLIYLSQKIEIFFLGRKESFKFGALYRLNKTILHAVSCL